MFDRIWISLSPAGAGPVAFDQNRTRQWDGREWLKMERESKKMGNVGKVEEALSPEAGASATVAGACASGREGAACNSISRFPF